MKKIEKIWLQIQQPESEKVNAFQLGNSNLWIVKDNKGAFGLVLDGMSQPVDYNYVNIGISFVKRFKATEIELRNCIYVYGKEGIQQAELCSLFSEHFKYKVEDELYSFSNIRSTIEYIHWLVKKISVDYNELIGYWGELYFIQKLLKSCHSDYEKTQVIDAWESENGRAVVDFTFNNSLSHAEVKTSTDTRIHKFYDLDQLKVSTGWNGYLVSILIEKNENGISCKKMMNSIGKILPKNTRFAYKRKLAIRGLKYAEDDRYKFKLQSKDSLNIYLMENVPRPQCPDKVYNTRWDSDLNEIPSIEEPKKVIQKILSF